MARVTIEDCLEQAPNRFALVIMAAVRTKQLMRGARVLVQGSENRSVVTSLREVAAGYVQPDAEVDAEAEEPATPEE